MNARVVRRFLGNRTARVNYGIRAGVGVTLTAFDRKVDFCPRNGHLKVAQHRGVGAGLL